MTQRPIKFRSWVSRKETYTDEDGIHELLPHMVYFLEASNARCFREIDVRTMDTMEALKIDVNEALQKWNEDGQCLMQFTGLHDKNGKEIWEGDIYNSPRRPGKNMIVEWHNYGSNDYELAAGWYIPRQSEVIGNIYENSDLLT